MNQLTPQEIESLKSASSKLADNSSKICHLQPDERDVVRKVWNLMLKNFQELLDLAYELYDALETYYEILRDESDENTPANPFQELEY